MLTVYMDACTTQVQGSYPTTLNRKEMGSNGQVLPPVESWDHLPNKLPKCKLFSQALLSRVTQSKKETIFYNFPNLICKIKCDEVFQLTTCNIFFYY